METVDVILLAGGTGSRVGGDLPKQFLPIGSVPMIIRALLPFTQLEFIGRRWITVPDGFWDHTAQLLQEYGIEGWELVLGGATRQESVRSVLERVQTRRVLTHNAALPFITTELIRNVADKDDPCVTTVTPFHRALCRGTEFAAQMVDRSDLNLINTPQSFDTHLFRECHRQAAREGRRFRTDCGLMMHYGHRVRFVPGSEANFKITTAHDLLVARALVEYADRRGDRDSPFCP